MDACLSLNTPNNIKIHNPGKYTCFLLSTNRKEVTLPLWDTPFLKNDILLTLSLLDEGNGIQSVPHWLQDEEDSFKAIRTKPWTALEWERQPNCAVQVVLHLRPWSGPESPSLSKVVVKVRCHVITSLSDLPLMVIKVLNSANSSFLHQLLIQLG